VPPTEKRGRVHTSTITVAVLSVPTRAAFAIDPNDLQVTTTRGSGPGGQNRNKVETEVVVLHKPTGLQVRCGSERSQLHNKQAAIEMLRSRLFARRQEQERASADSLRRRQVGSGQRGDKIRTIRTQANLVKCERTGRTLPFTTYARGYIAFE